MFEQVDERFECLLKIINNEYDCKLVIKAYEKAKELHFNQMRKDGTLYLSHPVEVAIILAELGFDQNTICAALLHDTVEDCGYSLEQIKKEFNAGIAELVDSVSCIDKTKYNVASGELFEDPEFVKISVEEQAFKKLINLGKKNPLGFCIKFADRLHNLRTIDAFPYAKQVEKVRETEKWVIPITKAIKAEYFYIQLKNECFKILHKIDGQEFFEQYKSYHDSNKNNVDIILKSLKEMYAEDKISKIFIDNLSERKVFDEISKVNKNIKIKEIPQGQIMKVENYVIYFTYENGLDNNITTNLTLAKFNKNNLGLKIVGAEIGNFSEMPYYIVRDELKNLYRLYILSEANYLKLCVGTLDGRYNDVIDEDNINSLDVDVIKVETRSGEIKHIAKNSTVLDFAFKLHKDVGFAFKYAIINDSKTQFPPYTKLNDGDKVEIITQKDGEGRLVNNARIRWLAYVNTELAKKVLVKWFENN